MATLGGTLKEPSPAIGDRRIDFAILPCQKYKCGIIAYVAIDADTKPPLENVATKVTKTGVEPPTGPGGKPTGGDGRADYRGLDPAAYTVSVALTPAQLKEYAWASTDDASTDASQDVPILLIKLFPFLAVPLVRPKIKVVWRSTPEALGRPLEDGDPEDGKAVPGVHVKLKDAIIYTDSNGDGIAELPGASRGLRPGSYEVLLTFDAENLELLDGRSIDVPKGSTATEIFHIRKCWVEFVVVDQFKRAFEGEADFVLTYPENKKTENGTLTANLKGKVKREVPAGEYKFELKLLYAAKWGAAQAEIGKEIALQTQATGYQAGDITFDIFDGCSPTGSPLDTVTASTLVDKTAEAKWTPDEEKLKAITSGTVRFIAKAGKSRAASAAIPILGVRRFTVTGTDDAPFETDLVLYFSDGGSIPARSAAGEAKPLVPLGKRLVAIELPGQSERLAIFQLAGASDKLTSFFP